MSDATPAFESPQFESPQFESPAFEDDLDDELEGDADDELEDEDEYEHEPSEVSDATNRQAGGSAKAVLEHIARSIVDDPDAVSVETSSERGGVKLSLHVAPGDMGRIIGKRGRVAQALRTVVRAAASNDGTDASVDIVD